MPKAPEILVTTAAACLLPVGAAITFIIAREIIHVSRNTTAHSSLHGGDHSFGRRISDSTNRRSNETKINSVLQVT
jgi:hypothetical protein